MTPAAQAAAAAAAVFLLALGTAAAVDLDGDGVGTWREVRSAGSALDPDSDGDGLHDGAERVLGTRADVADHDGDGLQDGDEVRRGGHPARADTDGDGIPDAEEPEDDCDGDGARAIASSDDDADGRPDGEEDAAERCAADVDGDDILDGSEGNPACVTSVDCDSDGLPDADEKMAAYDMLRADTFGIGLPDAVAYAFQQRGQEPTPDADGDGIPDGWEDRDGAIAWGDLLPASGRRDLLIEYLRVTGPDSGRYGWMDFTPAYDRVAQMFAQQGIVVQWRETVVQRADEQRPGFLAETDLPYYASVLDNGTHSTNPYVTTIVLNPQQTQQHPASILGAAFLRSMVATVDYGAHTEVVFRSGDDQTVRIRPLVESHIIGGQGSLYGFDSGGRLDDGRLYLREDYLPAIDQGYTITWHPDWFRSAPVYTTDDGQTFPLEHAGAVLHTAELASTIAHELGHTLGLCHVHETECQMVYGGLSLDDLYASTMSYASQQTAMHFLDVEWQFLGEYLRCPPQQTTALVAQGAARPALLAAKYHAAFTQETHQRECLELPVLAKVFDPQDATIFRLPDLPPPGHPGWPLLVLVLGAGAIASAAAAAVVLRGRQPL